MKLLFFIFTGLLFFESKSPFTFHQNHYPHFKLESGDPRGLALWEALMTGKTTQLPKMVKSHFQSLGLSHLFTPSGTHLQGANWLFKFIKFKKTIFSLLLVFLLCYQYFPALQRIIWVRLFQTDSTSLSPFILIMFLEGTIFSWYHSYLSWVCSWLFLGITLYAGRTNLWLQYCTGQILLSLLFEQKLHFTFPIWNLLSLLIVLLFPFLVLSYFLNISILNNVFSKILSWVVDLVEYFMDISADVFFYPHFFTLVLFLILYKKFPYRFCLIVSLIFLYSSPLNLRLKQKPLQSTWEMGLPEKQELLFTYWRRGDLWTKWRGNKTCQHRLVAWGWSERCRQNSTSRKNLKVSYFNKRENFIKR